MKYSEWLKQKQRLSMIQNFEIIVKDDITKIIDEVNSYKWKLKKKANITHVIDGCYKIEIPKMQQGETIEVDLKFEGE